MRELHSHRASPSDNTIKIILLDEPGAGGAYHEYDIEGPFGNITITFQNGPVAEVGVNGVTHEVLLAILIHRLESFQAGDFPSPYNATALANLERALDALKLRTRDRMLRGVEGTNQK